MKVARTDTRMLDQFVRYTHETGYRASRSDSQSEQAVALAALRLALSLTENEANAAVRHPLGFIRIPLTPWEPDQPRASLHIWQSDRNHPYREDIHDHCYDFLSLCITGGLEHCIYRFTRDSDALPVTETRYPAGSCADPGAPAGLLSVKLARQFQVRPWQAYYFSHKWLHRAAPLSSVAVSLQIQSPFMKPEATVLREIDRSNPPPTQSAVAGTPIGEIIKRVMGRA